MGGGCILDCIHEIDLAYWYVGKVESVVCVAGHLSSLEIDVEDVALLICKHKNEALSEIHLDFVQRTYERGCHIVGEKGSIFWDFNSGCVRLFESTRNSWTTFTQPDGWDINQMYVDELRHLLTCIQTGSPTTLSIPEAVEVMRIALAAKKSAHTGCLAATKEIT
jgi:predicted dehydrogenase